MNPSRHTPDDEFSALPDDAASQRAQSLLWLAESSPLAAAPADTLAAVRARLSLPAAQAPQRRWRMAALAGWAAAAALLAVMVWPRAERRGIVATSPAADTTARPPQPPAARTHGPDENTGDTTGTITPITDVEELRRQITELRTALKATTADQPGTHRPVIQELRPPGSTAPAAGSDRILDIIAGALEADLRRLTPDNSGEVIIESGWARWSSSLPADTVFRHRQFPKDTWASLGLLAGPGGQFLDPATGWLWSPDPAGTDYTGRAAPPDMDRTAFTTAPAGDQRPSAALAAAGYVLSAPGGQTIVSLSNLPPIPNGSTVSIASRSGTSWGIGNGVRYGNDFSIPASAYSSDGAWNFSGVIAQSVDLNQGFSLQVNSATGQSTTILSTGGTP